MKDKFALAFSIFFFLCLATLSFAPSYLQAQSSEADITAFSLTEQSKEATITPNIFDIGLTQINTNSFLGLVNSSGGTHYGNQIGLNPSFNQLDVNNLEIRFGQGTQKAHRFTIPVGSGPGVADVDYTYQDYIDVPFQVWDVDNNKQLMVSFRDQQDDGNFNLIEFNTMAGDEVNHSREYLLIHNIDYDANNANSNIALAGGHRFDWIYSIWPYLPTDETFDPNNLPVSTLAIEIANSSIDAEVIYGTDLTALVPTITVDANATVSPISGFTNNFTEPRIYKVTAEDGITFEKYLVTVGEGVLAYYPFNGSANDESGNGNDGIINGATPTLDKLGNANSAYSFNFQNTISTPLDLGLDQPFSFSAWVKWDGNLGSFQTILSWWIEGGRVYIDVDPDGQLRFGDFFLSTGVDMPANEWVHLAGTDDANNYIKLYLNGVLVAEKNTNTNYDPGPMTIGGKMYGSTIVESFSGDIDDIRIYGRALANNEVVDLSSRALFTETEITTFSIPGQISPAAIDNNNYTIQCEVLAGTDVTAMVAQFTLSSGAGAHVNAMEQVSGTTTNDFTNPLTYTIASEDELSTQDWIVEVGFGTATLENDSLALLAIYNNTDGANWTITWELLQPMDTWHGVTISNERVTSLDLNNNNLAGQFPVEIGILTGLTYLDLYGNQLSGVIPAEIGNLTNLTFLGLWKNQLSGNIPQEIGLLTELTNLDIGINQFIGSIPSKIWNLSKLEYLGIYSAPITGTIPTEIGNLVNLTWLQLLNTQISGEIPAEIGNLTKLEKLDLWNNQLTGSLPKELNNLTSLENLRLDRNNLIGSIPTEFGNLASLTILNLNDNQLAGTIPSSLGDLTNLTEIYIRNNELTGSIPNELGKLSNLTNISLRGNILSGSIPTELGNLTNLTGLFLYDNNLSGSIPDELGNLTNMETLSIEFNNLSGVIPATLGNLSNLNKLIINDNPNLSGSIPQSLSVLTLEEFSFQNTSVCEPTNLAYQNWKTTVFEYQSSGIVCEITSTDIEAFNIPDQVEPSTIDPTDHTVIISMPFATDVTTLISTFALSSGATAAIGATAQESGVTANDFTSSVVYSILAENEVTTQDWSITVTLAEPNSETDILGFSMGEQTGEGSIDAANHTITIEVFYGTSVTSLIPTLTLSDGASVDPGDQVAQDFTNPLVYIVTAEDGITKEAWTITVSVAPIDYGLLAWYPFNGNANDESGKGNDGTINGATLTLDRFENDNSAFSFDTPNTISTPLDLEFDQPFSFSVWVKWDGNSGSVQTILSWWILGGRVYIDVDANGQFRFGDNFGTTGIDLPSDEWVHVSGTDDAEGFIKLYVNGVLVAEENTDTNYDPGPMLIGGKNDQSSISETFSGDIDDIRIYDRVLQSVEILALFNEKNTKADILSFSLTEQTGEASIDQLNHTITIEVIDGTDVTSLTPTLTMSSGASVDPKNQEAQDFTDPVTYFITAEDGITIQDWIVTVTVAVEPPVLGIEDLIKVISLYPNPVENQLFIDLEGLNNQSLSITLSDLAGKDIAVFQGVGKNNLMINVENYKSGVYILLIQQGRSQRALRFIKN